MSGIKIQLTIKNVCPTCWKFFPMNLWMSAVLPTLLSPATTTVTSVSLANFMFVIVSELISKRLLIPNNLTSVAQTIQTTFFLVFRSNFFLLCQRQKSTPLYSLIRPVQTGITFEEINKKLVVSFIPDSSSPTACLLSSTHTNFCLILFASPKKSATALTPYVCVSLSTLVVS